MVHCYRLTGTAHTHHTSSGWKSLHAKNMSQPDHRSTNRSLRARAARRGSNEQWPTYAHARHGRRRRRPVVLPTNHPTATAIKPTFACTEISDTSSSKRVHVWSMQHCMIAGYIYYYYFWSKNAVPSFNETEDWRDSQKGIQKLQNRPRAFARLFFV